MKTYKRIIAYLLSFATLLSVCFVSAYADTPNVTYPTYWDYLAASYNRGNNFISHFFNDDICAHSPNPGGRHNFVERHTQVNGETGDFYVCEYCGKSGGEVLKPAYEQKVDEMPVNGIASDGSYVWYPTVENGLRRISGKHAFECQNDWQHVNFHSSMVDMPIVNKEYWPVSYSVTDLVSGFYVSIYNITDYYSFQLRNCAHSLYFIVPVDGRYSMRYPGDLISVCRDGTNVFEMYVSDWHDSHFRAGDDFQVMARPKDLSESEQKACYARPMPSANELSLSFYLPVFNVIPDVTVLQNHEHDYDPDTRPGETIQIDHVTIIDETNNYYTDPGTGEQTTIENWTYDYSDRSYHVTTNEGDNITVTYGDEHVTIENGGNTYTYNYTIEQAPCNHNYVASSSNDPTCTVNGSVLYTCSECGATYTETVPPLGHDWEFVESVPAVTDENENVTQEAYDLYRCRRCGEERRVPVGSAPATDGENENGFFSWLRKWLIAFKEWLGDMLEKLRGGGNTNITNDLNLPDDGPNGGDDNHDPADDRAHSHDDDDGVGWLMWFVRKITKIGARAFRGLAGAALEDALDGASDNLDGFKQFYLDKPGDAIDGFAAYDERTVFQ